MVVDRQTDRQTDRQRVNKVREGVDLTSQSPPQKLFRWFNFNAGSKGSSNPQKKNGWLDSYQPVRPP